MPALLDLVRKLIEYGKELAATLHQRAAENPYFAPLNFGTNDLAVALARITRGLLRAQALEERLARLAARPNRQPGPDAAKLSRKPRAARPAVQRAQVPDSPLAQMPTPREIAAAVRRQPIGAVIADICRDLAILPNHPLWRELQNAIMKHGGSYVRLLKHVITRNYRLAFEIAAPPEPASAFLRVPAPTGPGPP
jgi:hypothetical protein